MYPYPPQIPYYYPPYPFPGATLGVGVPAPSPPTVTTPNLYPPPQNPQEKPTQKDESSTEEKKKKERSPKLEVWGNAETMNLPEMVLVNIQASEYFKSL
jgi:hypothetical protein